MVLRTCQNLLGTFKSDGDPFIQKIWIWHWFSNLHCTGPSKTTEVQQSPLQNLRKITRPGTPELFFKKNEIFTALRNPGGPQIVKDRKALIWSGSRGWTEHTLGTK